jgi:hypothetical protein
MQASTKIASLCAVLMLLLWCGGAMGQSPPSAPNLEKRFEAQSLALPSAMRSESSPAKILAPTQSSAGMKTVQIPRLVLPQISTGQLEREDDLRRKSPEFHKRRDRIGLNRAVSINTAEQGSWSRIEGGGWLWVLQITSPGARNLRVHFGTSNLSGDAKLFVFSPSAPLEVAQYATSVGPNSEGFWSTLLKGDTAQIELLMPASESKPEVSLSITQIGHTYRNAFVDEESKAGSDGDAGACNLDVACYPEWSTLSKSVVRLVHHDSEFIYSCSGVLVNNNSNDFSPFVLTANHCIDFDVIAQSTVVLYGEQNQNCNGNVWFFSYQVGPTKLLATNVAADTSLLQVPSAVSGDAVWAGWSLGAVGAGIDVTGIHHPRFSYRRIAFGKSLTYDPTFANTHPVRWISGITEPGSSGSPLFNAEKQILGVLSGGYSSCSVPHGIDYYGQLAAAYPSFTNGSGQNYLQQGLPDDAYFPNQTRETATPLAAPEASVTNLVLKPNSGEDWFRMTVPGPKIIRIESVADDFIWTYSVELYRGDGPTPVRTITQGNGSFAEYVQDSVNNEDYYIRVKRSYGVRVGYSLKVRLRPLVAPEITTLTLTPHYSTGYKDFAAFADIKTGGWPVNLKFEYGTDNSTFSPVSTVFGGLSVYRYSDDVFKGSIGINELESSTRYYVRATAETVGGTATYVNSIVTQPFPPPVLYFPQKDYPAGLHIDMIWQHPESVGDFDLYLGTTPDPPFFTSGKGTRYYTNPFAYFDQGTKYYWRVVQKRHDLSASSLVASFTTGTEMISATPDVVSFGDVLLLSQTKHQQTIVLENAGNLPAIFSGQSSSSDFEFDIANCGYFPYLQYPPCNVKVTFNPKTFGAKSGVLTFKSTRGATLFSVALSGTAVDLYLSLTRPSRPLRGGISPGQSETFAMTISPQGGFSGTVALGCGNVPIGVQCTVTPAIVTVDKASITAEVKVTVAQRSRRLIRVNSPNSSYVLQLNATTKGVTRSIDLPITIRR